MPIGIEVTKVAYFCNSKFFSLFVHFRLWYGSCDWTTNALKRGYAFCFNKKSQKRGRNSFELFIYELETKNGKIDIIKGLYRYDKGTIKTLCRYHYQADWIKYTQEGYFFFSGVCYSEEFYVLSLSGVEEYTAFRVQPLDERCRELNRKYLLPISYERNNLFLIDWNEGDYGVLDFYDVFDRCYPLVNAQENPYVMADDLGIGAVYRIPRMEFEQVVMTYFPIDSQTLQSKTMWSDTSTNPVKSRHSAFQ